MKQKIGRHLGGAVLALLVTAVGVTPASAQQELGERITILVPNLAPAEGLRDRFGQQVARELRRAIEDLHTHQTVGDRELRNALRQYNLREADLYDCLRARQLAMQMGWGLVVCGQYEPAPGGEIQVTANFVSSETGDGFEVPPFTASERDARGAAQQILQTFDRWQTQLRFTFFCSEYVDTEAWDQAITNCERALAINPTSRAANYLMAIAKWRTGERSDALSILDGMLDRDPLHQDALQLAGIIATEAGDRDRARSYFDRYMELNPGDVRVRLTVAMEIAQAGDPEGAMRFAQEGMAIEPDNLTLMTYIGHFATNAAVQAEARMSNGSGTGTGTVDPARVTELYQTAARMYERVFDEQGIETEPQILERLVIAKFKLGAYDEAVTLGQRATEARPDNVGIWEAYSRALAEAGRVDEALRAIEQVEQLGRSTASLTQRKAMLQLRQGSTEAAIATLTRGVEAGQIQPADGYRIMFAHAWQDNFQRGRHDAAYRILEQAGPLAVTESDQRSRNFWRGYILFLQGQQAHEPATAESARRAKPLFERALELFQRSRGYEREHPSANVPALIENTQRFIEIQDALIRRGR